MRSAHRLEAQKAPVEGDPTGLAIASERRIFFGVEGYLSG
jgi:hypothetical protein